LPAVNTTVEEPASVPGVPFGLLKATDVPTDWTTFPPQGFLSLTSGTDVYKAGYSTADTSTWVRQVIWTFKSVTKAQSAVSTYASKVGDLSPVTFPSLGDASEAYSLGDTTGLVGGGAILYTVLVRRGADLCVLTASDLNTLGHYATLLLR
jgi:hypothetical protein